MQARTRGGFIAGFSVVAITIVLCLAAAEIILRLVPSLISVPLLAHFPAPLRHEIAVRLNLPSLDNNDVIESAQRADRGPPIYHPAPNSAFRRVRDDADIPFGAVETVMMDARGFCNPPDKGQRAQAEVVFIGDSFTFCTGVEPTDTATHYVERDGGFSTYNLGIPGVGLHEYVELLRLYGLALKPRLVVMNVYEGNDLRDAVRYSEFLKSGEDRRAGEKRLHALLSYSYAVSLLYAAGEWLSEDIGAWFGDDVNFRYSGTSEGRTIEMNVTNNDKSEVRYASRLKEGKISVDLWAQPIGDLKALADAANFIPVIVYTPSMYTAYADSVKFEDEQTGSLVRGMSDAQRKWLATKTAEAGIEYIDLTPAFQKAARDGPLTHFPANVHLTPPGHKIVSSALLQVIVKHQNEIRAGN
jgi:hypothetical protein